MKKTFCLDTNVFLYDPRAIFAFDDNDVVIPLVVLEEIDKQKNSRFDEAGHNARATNRLLDEMRSQGNLVEGVKLPAGGMLRIIKSDYDENIMPSELVKDKADNHIISTALSLKASLGPDAPVYLITKDISMRIKCDILGVPCDDYLKHRVASGAEHIYGGVQVIPATKDDVDRLFQDRRVTVASLHLQPESVLQPNEYVVLKDIVSGSSSGLARRVGDELRCIVSYDTVWGLTPRNKEQKFSLDMLMDPSINIATMIGPAGCGKTLLALAAGLEQVLQNKTYKKLIISRPVQPLGRDIGYLPGTKEEKMEPWIRPMVDNLEFLFGPDGMSNLNMYRERGLIEVEAITYIRGRSIPNAYIIIDEAQNLSVHELKTIVTRVGEGTKIVLTGDIEQVDNNQVDAVSNGLSYAVEKLKSYDLSAHITLLKGERSTLASLAAKIL